MILTRDGATAPHAIADEAGVDELHADLLPEDKTRVVEALVRQHRHVAMVGDGVNDAPALAAATVGIVGIDVASGFGPAAYLFGDKRPERPSLGGGRHPPTWRRQVRPTLGALESPFDITWRARCQRCRVPTSGRRSPLPAHAAEYVPREPQDTLLHRLVRKHYATFVAHTEA